MSSSFYAGSPAYQSHWRGYPVAVAGTPAVWGRTSATEGDVQKLASRAQLARRLRLSKCSRSLIRARLVASSAATGNVGFGFNARDISGFPTGSATLTGGGSYNPVTGFVNSGGGFRCTSNIGQGPLAGCLSGEGVRWDTVELRRSTTFKCTRSAAEPLKTATTNENTVVLLADFYRAGDGIDESFTAQLIVSADDIAPDIAGTQNVWIQGVGCASAIANFSS